MPTPGYVFRDSGITPPAEEEGESARRQLVQGNQYQSTPASQAPQTTNPPPQQKTTDSHALALADHEIKGAAQISGGTPIVTDLGWRSHPKDVDTLVGGLPNEELWTLVRRFNRVRPPASINWCPNLPIANVSCQSHSKSTIRRS